MDFGLAVLEETIQSTCIKGTYIEEAVGLCHRSALVIRNRVVSLDLVTNGNICPALECLSN